MLPQKRQPNTSRGKIIHYIIINRIYVFFYIDTVTSCRKFFKVSKRGVRIVPERKKSPKIIFIFLQTVSF